MSTLILLDVGAGNAGERGFSPTIMGDTNSKAIVRDTSGRRIFVRTVRVEQIPAPQVSETCTKAEACARIAEFSRAELDSSLRALVHLRDFSCKDSVRLGATKELIALAMIPDGGTASAQAVQALGISSDQLSEFLRKVSNTSR